MRPWNVGSRRTNNATPRPWALEIAGKIRPSRRARLLPPRALLRQDRQQRPPETPNQLSRQLEPAPLPREKFRQFTEESHKEESQFCALPRPVRCCLTQGAGHATCHYPFLDRRIRCKCGSCLGCDGDDVRRRADRRPRRANLSAGLTRRSVSLQGRRERPGGGRRMTVPSLSALPEQCSIRTHARFLVTAGIARPFFIACCPRGCSDAIVQQSRIRIIFPATASYARRRGWG